MVRSFTDVHRKYTMFADDWSNMFGHFVRGSKVLTLTEDTISALRCSEICDTMSLLGVNIKPRMIEEIAKEGYTDVVIFLDGDNPRVRMAARKIAKRLPFLRTRIVETGNDPKHYSREELECLILTS